MSEHENQDNNEQRQECVASLSFHLLDSGDYDIHIDWDNNEGDETATGLANLLTYVNMGFFIEDILKILLERKGQLIPEKQEFLSDTIRLWSQCIRMAQSSEGTSPSISHNPKSRTVKPSQVFSSLRKML